MIEHLPDHVHLILATRVDPHVRLACVRASDHWNEIRAADIRFRQDVPASFLKQSMRLDRAEQDLDAIEDCT